MIKGYTRPQPKKQATNKQIRTTIYNAIINAEPTTCPKEDKPSNDLAYNINLTKHYHENLRFTSLSLQAMDEIGESIHNILEILYQAYGITKYKEDVEE